MTSSQSEVASSWLAQFSTCLQRRDAMGTADLFASDGWLRHFLVFQWDLRTLHGYEKISAYLSSYIQESSLTNFELASDQYFKPSPGRKEGDISSGFTFSTPIANGRGSFNLVESNGEWKASTVFMMLDSLKGNEELGADEDLYEGRFPTWFEAREKQWECSGKDPEVLIVGAGGNGLQVAARFRQMKIPALVIERKARVGDTWRGRHPTLKLHSPREHHSFLYQPYPENWPLWTPGSKLGDWLEQYAVLQDLLVWTNSNIVSPPSYDRQTKEWTVNIDKSGQLITVHPNHIVVATGIYGKPVVPTYEGQDQFEGQILHAATFPGGSYFAGKRCVVVGTGTSGHDIALDLSTRGAESVTLIQRSSTCVQPGDLVAKQLQGMWPAGVPVEVSDFRRFSTPVKLGFEILAGARKHGEMWEKEKCFMEQLEKAGMNINMGPFEAGVLGVVFSNHHGFWMDVGCAERILSGQIQIKSGIQITRLDKNSITFTDGSTVEADVVIFATGYGSMKEYAKDLLSDDVVSQAKSLPYGVLDEEGELPAGYRPTGHPGLWFASGLFPNARFQSKILGIQIQAIKLGYIMV
ncbi:hypothetical protein GYMLUDRAFT_264910 [Collybiopsis luxurians FD-317 M1]|uniref:FAD/NAD(P)-binding domain-containing protein n=1 Tax=Collybiopsis luxurians FD-317 M1 TaxID=944289 RepID=A0A0D0BW01_9AGAR|nr:hypothetical protein GYMLUDRAFT_264910 [Collybiopsis luxurians FD-317 M1]